MAVARVLGVCAWQVWATTPTVSWRLVVGGGWVCGGGVRGGSPLLLCGVVVAGGAGFGRVCLAGLGDDPYGVLVCQWRGWGWEVFVGGDRQERG